MSSASTARACVSSPSPSRRGAILPAALRALDDYDPAWLPDGRIVFASTRWPSFAHYGGVRTSNLYVMDADGGRLHRITAERNGADCPAVDPATGQIVFARWWRNQRFPLDRLDARSGAEGIEWKDGLSAVRGVQLDGRPESGDLLWRNAWQLATIRPDGTELALWGAPPTGASMRSATTRTAARLPPTARSTPTTIRCST